MASMYLLAADAASEFYQFARVQAMSEWWHWLVLMAVCAAVLVYVVVMYRFDSVELSRGLSWLLVGLRLLAFAGVLFYFLNLEKRAERKLVKNSRALLLVDTSQSMGLPNSESANRADSSTRIQQVVNELATGPLLEDLRQKHDVVVYRFDQESKPSEVASLPKLASADDDEPTLSAAEVHGRQLREARTTATVAGAFLLASVLFGFVHLMTGRGASSPDRTAWALLVSLFSLIVAVVVLAVGNLRNPDVGFLAMIGLEDGQFTEDDTGTSPDPESEAESLEPANIDWPEALAAHGLKTRLGEALRYLVNKERGGPVAGIVVFTDGQRNAGAECSVATTMARLAEIPVYTVGMGSEKRPENVLVLDLDAPERVYPGDRFTVTGHIQATNVNSRSVQVKLTSAPTGAAEGEKVETVEEEDRVELGEDGKIVTIKFEVTPKESGRRTYKLSVTPPAGDQNKLDDFKTANVEVVERKTKVLLMAGGPSREFRFLRNLLFRDRDTTVDVWLQTGKPGISQEADDLLFDFPESADELFEYDCIVAFDPDWTQLDFLHIQDLEKWIAEKAGGLIVVAGPVHTPQWADLRRSDTRFDTIRSLYPVALYTSGSATLGLGRFGGKDSWPLEFTREGLESEFLWLEDDPVNSEGAWASFEGVYGYYAVKDPKPGARIYARFSDPSTSIDEDLPIYLAGHFYGAGRVFFQASGEMWRIRALDETYFERYYTKLLRWVAQGRLLRDSVHGVLLVDKDRCLLGDTVVVQAILTDSQNQPLTAPEVTGSLIQPNGNRTALTLRAVKGGARDGTYAGQFTAVEQNDYRLELRPPHAELDELLVREVRVRAPEVEIEKPERNDPLLTEIAQTTGGEYYVGIDAAVGRAGSLPPLVNALQTQDHVTYLPGTPDRDFERRLMTWLMGLICGLLAFEWLLRRISRLA
ncbi:MAG: VWA domain-containing protein [Planctomycetes bacterium]|nr:VWA domain-containing protein [Planctomycetota bacterium]MBL7040124.1 VWA domain-containing protein [Pirellulaceae bacterium]